LLGADSAINAGLRVRLAATELVSAALDGHFSKTIFRIVDYAGFQLPRLSGDNRGYPYLSLHRNDMFIYTTL
jgi:hypothetical protein